MSESQKQNPENFPRWVCWYRPAEQEDGDDNAENGVINGVGRKLDGVAKDLNAEIGSQLQTVTAGMDQLKMENLEATKQLHVDDKVEKLEKAMNANMEEVTATMETMQAEMASKLGHCLQLQAHRGRGRGRSRRCGCLYACV